MSISNNQPPSLKLLLGPDEPDGQNQDVCLFTNERLSIYVFLFTSEQLSIYVFLLTHKHLSGNTAAGAGRAGWAEPGVRRARLRSGVPFLCDPPICFTSIYFSDGRKSTYLPGTNRVHSLAEVRFEAR